MSPGLRGRLTRLVAAQVSLHAAMAGLRLAAPLLALREGHSALAVGVLMALFALSQVFLALPAGRFTDRHGLHRPMRLAVAVALTGGTLAVIWPVYLVLCVAALCAGAASGLSLIALQRYVGTLADGPAGLRQVFSAMSTGPAIANVVGPFLAGLVIDLAGFRAAFFALACLPPLALLALRTVPEAPPRPAPDTGTRRASRELLALPGFRRLLVVNWLLSSCWDVHTFVVPVLGHERGFSASVIGTLLGAFAVAAALIRISLHWVARQLHEHQIIGGAMLATGVLFGLYPFMPNAWAMGACSVLLGLVLGSAQPMIMSTLHQITPEHRQGEALGLRLLSINASSVLMPSLFGLAGAVAGVAPVFWVVGAAVGLGARTAWRMGHTQPPAGP